MPLTAIADWDIKRLLHVFDSRLFLVFLVSYKIINTAYICINNNPLDIHPAMARCQIYFLARGQIYFLALCRIHFRVNVLHGSAGQRRK